jgi:hypothetical protein
MIKAKKNVDVLENTENGTDEIAVSLRGHECSTNCTTEQLAPDGVFLGDWQDTIDFGTVTVGIITDVDSAIDGLVIQWSSDKIAITQDDKFTVLATRGKTFKFGPANRYYRVQYTNGSGGTTTTLNIESIMRRVYVIPSSHRVSDPIVGDDDAQLVKNVNTGEDKDGNFKNIRSTPDGSLFTTDFLLEVAKGNIPGHTFDRKFGENPIIQAADPADLWEYGKTAGAELYTFSADGVADITGFSSDNASDTGIDITITGLDINGVEVIQTIATNGSDGRTTVPLATPLWRLNRAYNDSGTPLAGNIYIYTSAAVVTLGVPAPVTTVRGYISILEGQTLQGIYTVPAGKTGYIMGRIVSLSKGGGATAVGARFTGSTRIFGKTKRTQETFNVISSGTSSNNAIFPIALPFPEKTDFIPNADVTANNIGVSISYSILLVDNI